MHRKPLAFRPRRRWGQHFLVNAGAVQAILAAFDARPDDLVVEIGPGQALWTPMGLEHGIARVVEDTTIVWSEMTLRGLKRPGHLHRGEGGPNTTGTARGR